MKRYKTIVIDPPWPGPGASPAFDAQAPLRLIPYHTMTGVQCAALNVRTVADDDAQLFLWATSRALGDAYLLLQTWAFSFRGLFIWKKSLGLGRHVRSEAEFLLWGGRHGAPLVQPTNCPRQIQEWKRPGGHSEKPEGAYDLIRELSVGPRLDIFARKRRDGFDAWGDDLPESEAVQGVFLMPNVEVSGPAVAGNVRRDVGINPNRVCSACRHWRECAGTDGDGMCHVADAAGSPPVLTDAYSRCQMWDANASVSIPGGEPGYAPPSGSGGVVWRNTRCVSSSKLHAYRDGKAICGSPLAPGAGVVMHEIPPLIIGCKKCRELCQNGAVSGPAVAGSAILMDCEGCWTHSIPIEDCDGDNCPLCGSSMLMEQGDQFDAAVWGGGYNRAYVPNTGGEH